MPWLLASLYQTPVILVALCCCIPALHPYPPRAVGLQPRSPRSHALLGQRRLPARRQGRGQGGVQGPALRPLVRRPHGAQRPAARRHTRSESSIPMNAVDRGRATGQQQGMTIAGQGVHLLGGAFTQRCTTLVRARRICGSTVDFLLRLTCAPHLKVFVKSASSSYMSLSSSCISGLSYSASPSLPAMRALYDSLRTWNRRHTSGHVCSPWGRLL